MIPRIRYGAKGWALENARYRFDNSNENIKTNENVPNVSIAIIMAPTIEGPASNPKNVPAQTSPNPKATSSISLCLSFPTIFENAIPR